MTRILLALAALTLLVAVACELEPTQPAATPVSTATVPPTNTAGAGDTDSTATAAPEPTLTPTPEPGFGDGTWIVGTDIAPGLYVAPGSSLCYWARLSGFGGTLDEIKANDVGVGRKLVAIAPTDAGFETSNCGRWKPHVEISNPLTRIPEGTWMVGVEVSPGTYSAPGGALCYWARLSGFGDELDDIITNDVGAGRKLATIAPTDAGFHTGGCGLWDRVN